MERVKSSKEKIVKNSTIDQWYQWALELSEYFLPGYGPYLDMVRVVPVQAPKNFTADINLRKGANKFNASLPFHIQKTNIDDDYPYLTKDIASLICKPIGFVASAMKNLNLKGNKDFHQSIKASKNGEIHRYSKAALSHLQQHLEKDSDYNPYKSKNC